MRGFIIGTLATAVTFAIVAYLLPQIDYGDSITGLIVVALIAGVVNGFIKPIIKLFSLPLTLMTFGLFGLVINAGLLLLIAWRVEPRRHHVHGRRLSARPVDRRDRRRGDRWHRHLDRRGAGRQGGPGLTLSARQAAALRSAAARFGTPVFVTDLATLAAACADTTAAFPDPIVRQYSVKANDVPAVIAAVTERGFGANVVSRGEWALARRAGVPNERITLEGIGKTPADLRAAARAAATASRCAGSPSSRRRRPRRSPWRPPAQHAPRIDVLYRLNPDVAPETLTGLAVGAGATKFGMTETEIATAIEAGGGPDGPLRSRGIHLHVGSQLGAVDAWRDAVRKALSLAALWRGSIETFDTVDLGGGFPVRPTDEPSPSPERFARELGPLLEAVPEDRRPTRLAIEPGRALVARAGWLVARVLHVRDRAGRQVDPGRGDDRAHPSRAVRRAPPDRRVDVGRPSGRSDVWAGHLVPGPRRGPDLRIDRFARDARPPSPAARGPRRDRRRRRLRGLARIHVQRAPAAAAGPPRH